jgi:HAD superfamily phosphatase (TIGR01668 family)
MLEKFYPDIYLNSVYDITTEFLNEKGLKGIIFDIDNTLVPMHQPRADDKTIHWLNYLISEGIKVIIVSNARLNRVKEFCRGLDVPYIYKASKPFSGAFIKASSQMRLRGNEIAMVGDQIFTDIIGGNRLDMFTILVKPINPKELITIRLKRVLEKVVINDFKTIKQNKLKLRKKWKIKTEQKLLKKRKIDR